MSVDSPNAAVEMVGRVDECARIDRLIGAARLRASNALVVRGEAGAGKTTLLDYAEARAGDLRIVRATGVEFESELAFSALTQLTRPLLSLLGQLPPVQATALSTAVAAGDEGTADRFTVYAATLALLTAAAAESGLLCLVDDAHWLDAASAEALVFAARRLHIEGVLMLFATREAPTFAAPGLDTLSLDGLDAASGAALAARYADITSEAAAQLVTATRGNPLALIELPRVFSSAEWNGLSASGEPVPMTERMEQAFAMELARLGPTAREALLVCAICEVDDLDTVGAALAARGIGLTALDEAVRVRLLVVRGDRVAFRHPLIRSAVYTTAPPGARQAGHLAVAEVMRRPQDADRQAWHRARGAQGANAATADALVATADRARRRGGVVAEAMAYERAAALTEDRQLCGARLAMAATSWRRAGHMDRAYDLLQRAMPLVSGTPVRFQLLGGLGYLAMLRGESQTLLARVSAEVQRCTPDERFLAGRAFSVAMNGPLSKWDVAGVVAVCEEVMRLTSPDGPNLAFPKAAIRLAHAYALAGRSDAADLARSLAPMCLEHEPDGSCAELADVLIWLAEYPLARQLVERDVADARAVGDVALLAYALDRLARLEIRLGRLAAAEAAAAESVELGEAMGQTTNTAYFRSTLAVAAALLGDAQRCRTHADTALAVAESLGHVALESYARLGPGIEALTAGRYAEAVAHLGRIAELMRVGGVAEQAVLPVGADLAEAYLRTGDTAAAERELALLESAAQRTGRAGLVAAAARTRALLTDGRDAERHYAKALSTADTALEAARTVLYYGRWLRRRKRRRDARAHLYAALQAFEAIGAACWARQAQEEIAASGEHRQPSSSTSGLDRLTPQEQRIVSAAREGLTSREIATRMGLSTKTVDHHLSSVYRKLGLRSRRELILRIDDI